MTSAREIYTKDGNLSLCGCSGCISSVVEMIQQAREDGARWAIEQVKENSGHAWEIAEDLYDNVNPADVRKVAP